MDRTVDEAVLEYLDLKEKGLAPTPEEFAALHPDVADELLRRIETLSRVMEVLGTGAPVPVAGQRIGGYAILREIGRGSMGVVYLVERTADQKPLAMKFLPGLYTARRRTRDRFLHEADTLKRLHHPNVVTVHEVGEMAGSPYFVMDYVTGKSLDVIIESWRAGREDIVSHDPAAVASLIAQTARGLEHVHAHGVIHRDVKPSNILLTDAGHSKVTDFGLARVEGALSLSRTGDFSGTPYYMSPEQALGRRRVIDHRTDIFSLGATLYESITLARPFEGDTSHEILRRIIFHEPRHPVRVNSRVPRDLAVICQKAMEKDPARRYRTMEAFAQDLRRFLNHEPILAKPVTLPGRAARWIRRHPFLALVTGTAWVGLCVTAVLLGVVARQKRTEYASAVERFRPVDAALERQSLFPRYLPWQWCMDADPGAACGPMLKALRDLHRGALQEAALDLDRSLECTRQGKDPSLEREVHYMLAVVLFLQGLGAPAPRAVDGHRIGEAWAHYEAAGRREPGDPECLFLRLLHEEDLLSRALPREALALRVRADHFLVQLYLGIALFDELYKGGEIGRFERAIRHFEHVLERRPDCVPAQVFLGRTLFFFARFYQLLDRIPEAEKHLKRALALQGDRSFDLTLVTLGQIALLEQENDRAMQWFQKAVARPGTHSPHVHNAYRGMAIVLARQGRPEEAEAAFERAASIQPDDPHLNAARAEFHLQRGDLERALTYADRAKRYSTWQASSKRETFVAEGHLVLARILLARKRYAEARSHLEELFNVAVLSPRDLSWACLLLATFPESMKDRGDTDLSRLAAGMASEISRYAPEPGRATSAASRARAVASYLRGKTARAEAGLAEALERRSRWPEATARYRRFEDACDLYLLALVRNKGNGDGDGKEGRGREAFLRAEALRRGMEGSFEKADILRRLREKASVSYR